MSQANDASKTTMDKSTTESNTGKAGVTNTEGAPCWGLCLGMWLDLKRRAPYYFWDDWVQGFNLKVLASILFMFFTSIGPAVTFSVLLEKETDNDVGVIEVIISTAISGIVFSIFGGQPLVILGVTGPVTIFTITTYSIAESWGLNFLPFYGWTQIWAAIMHVILAVTNMSDMIRWVTRYSSETFGVLIAIIYLYTGIRGMVEYFTESEDYDDGQTSALLQLIFALGTAFVALQLTAARGWKVGNGVFRKLVADYGASISMIVWTGVAYIGRNKNTDVDTLDAPDNFSTTSGRSWLVDLTDIPVWGVFAALLPGFILTVLFFFDHNVSSLLAQVPEFNLQKGSAFHWDFFIVGVNIFITGILGIPPTNGLIPQAPLHTKSLCEFTQQEVADPNSLDGGTKVKEVVTHVYEQRVSNLMQAVLIGIMAFFPFVELLKLIPNACLDGLFIYMGIASFPGNQFAERVSLLFVEPQLRTSHHHYLARVPFSTVRNFTLLQAAICTVIFVITLTPAAMVFPVLIAVVVPARKFLFPKMFDRDALYLLDHEGIPVGTDFDVDSDVDEYEFNLERGHIAGTRIEIRVRRPSMEREELGELTAAMWVPEDQTSGAVDALSNAVHGVVSSSSQVDEIKLLSQQSLDDLNLKREKIDEKKGYSKDKDKGAPAGASSSRRRRGGGGGGGGEEEQKAGPADIEAGVEEEEEKTRR